MKMPDKICVAPHQIFDYDLEIQEVGHNGAEEYIRKDALREWTNKMLQDTADRLDFHGNQAFIELYHKLNSM